MGEHAGGEGSVLSRSRLVRLRQEEAGMGHLLSPRQGWSAGNARTAARRPGSGAVMRPGSAGTRRGPDL